jgi:hypothetical protein
LVRPRQRDNQPDPAVEFFNFKNILQVNTDDLGPRVKKNTSKIGSLLGLGLMK